MTPGKKNDRFETKTAVLHEALDHALREPDEKKRAKMISEVQKLLEDHQNDIDLASEILDGLDSMKSSVKDLEPLLRYGPTPDHQFRYGENLSSYKKFDKEYATLRGHVENALNPLLEEIIEGMAEDLYEFGTFGSADFADFDEKQRHLKEVFGPKGNVHLKQFHELKLGRKLHDPNKDRTPTHLRNVLFLSLIRNVDGTRTTQKEIGELTDYGQSKISLDLFMAKQVLLESWLEERIKSIPNLEITIGATGVSPTNQPTPDIDDTYYRWPRDGFGYLVLEHTITKKPAVIMLHIFENRIGTKNTITDSTNYREEANFIFSKLRRNPRYLNRPRNQVIRSYVNQLQTSFDSNLAKGYPDSFSKLPIGHFLSSGRHYETAFVLDKNLLQYFETPDIGGSKVEDLIGNLFV